MTFKKGLVGGAVVLAIAALGLGVILSAEETSCAPGGRPLSAYEWRTSAWDTSASATDLITAAEALCLDTIHVDVTGLATPGLQDKTEDSLVALLDIADQSPVTIGALAGDPWWPSSEDLNGALLVLEGLERINQGRDDPVRTLHLDVEPWGLEDWPERRSDSTTEYINFVADVVTARDRLEGPAVHLSFLIPYWFDGSNDEVPRIEVKGVLNHPFQHLDEADSEDVTWVVMAYRNRAGGEGGILDLLSQEVDMSDRVGLAVETAPVEPESITFANQSLNDLDRELASVWAAEGELVEMVVNDFEHLRLLADQESP